MPVYSSLAVVPLTAELGVLDEFSRPYKWFADFKIPRPGGTKHKKHIVFESQTIICMQTVSDFLAHVDETHIVLVFLAQSAQKL